MRGSDASMTGKALRYWDPGSGFSHAGNYLMRSAEDGRGTGRKPEQRRPVNRPALPRLY